MKRYLILLLLFLSAACALPTEAATPKSNAEQARILFNKVYNKVFGQQGCTLSYSINIIGLYKTAGTVTMRGKRKMHYTEKRYHGWMDGKTLYRADTKKHVVDIFDPDKQDKDNMVSQYTYDLAKFKYSWESSDEGIVINIDAPKGSKGISHAKAVLDRHTLNPIAVKVKVAFFWTTVKITGFRTGHVNDALFVFPRNQFKSYKFVDHR